MAGGRDNLFKVEVSRGARTQFIIQHLHSLTDLPPQTQKQIATDRRYGLDRIKSLNMPRLARAMVRAKEPGYTSYYSPIEQTRQIVGFAPLDVQPWVLG